MTIDSYHTVYISSSTSNRTFYTYFLFKNMVSSFNYNIGFDVSLRVIVTDNNCVVQYIFIFLRQLYLEIHMQLQT